MFDIKKAKKAIYVQDVIPDGDACTPPFLLIDDETFFFGFIFYSLNENSKRDHAYLIVYFNQEYEFLGEKDINYNFHNDLDSTIIDEYETLLLGFLNKQTKESNDFDDIRFTQLNNIVFEELISEVNKTI